MSMVMYKESEIVELCRVDAKIINLALSKSRELGRMAIKDAIANFQNFLFSKKGTTCGEPPHHKRLLSSPFVAKRKRIKF